MRAQDIGKRLKRQDQTIERLCKEFLAMKKDFEERVAIAEGKLEGYIKQHEAETLDWQDKHDQRHLKERAKKGGRPKSKETSSGGASPESTRREATSQKILRDFQGLDGES